MDTETKIIGRCPVCGGNVVKTCKGYRCENNTGEDGKCGLLQEGSPCDFVIWRNIAGHLMTLDEVREICADGVTSHEVEMFGENGSVYRRKLGLSPDKLKVIKV